MFRRFDLSKMLWLILQVQKVFFYGVWTLVSFFVEGFFYGMTRVNVVEKGSCG